MLDTGCSQTMVHSRLIPSDQLLEGDGVVVRCAHGDSVLYPLCNVRIELEGRTFKQSRPCRILYTHPYYIGHADVSELGKLLGTTIAPRITSHASEQRAYVVTTRAKEAAEASKEQEERSSEEKSGVNPNPVAVESSTEREVWDLGNEMDDCIFEGGYSRPKQTRRQKRIEREGTSKRQNCMELDTAGQQRPETDDVLGSSAEELRASQEADPTLAAVRKAVSGAEDDRSGNYYKKGGLLYHRRKHADACGGGGEDSAVEQLVLPKKFHKAVLNLAHMQCSHSWPSGEAENGGPPIAKVPLAGSAPRCGMLLQGLRRMPEAVQRESLQGTTGSTPRDFCTIRTYSYGHIVGPLPRSMQSWKQLRREGYQRPGAGQCISAPSLSTSIVKSQNKAARGCGGAL